MAAQVFELMPVPGTRLIARDGADAAGVSATVLAETEADARRLAREQDRGLRWDDQNTFECRPIDTPLSTKNRVVYHRTGSATP
jgi:hypothetical protein